MSVNLDLPTIVDIDDSLDVIIDFFETQQWTDGLPFIPPTRQRVDEMFRYVDFKPDDVIATLAPRNGEATVEALAINAVMAGCRPEYFPVVVAATQAVAEKPFNLNGIQSTTHSCAVLVFVNGPIGREININNGYNLFGQGFRANATIGRALRLILLNIAGGTPGEGDRSTIGTPAKFSFCAAEAEELNPWEPLHVEMGFDVMDSTVTVMAAEAPHNVNDHWSVTGAGLLNTIGLSMRQPGSNNMTYRGGQPLIVLGPEHAEAIARDGISKDDAKKILWEVSHLYLNEMTEDWLEGQAHWAGPRADVDLPDAHIVGEHWSRLNIVVAGGAGKHSCWIPTFGPDGMTNTVTTRINNADGSAIKSVYENVQ